MVDGAAGDVFQTTKSVIDCSTTYYDDKGGTQYEQRTTYVVDRAAGDRPHATIEELGIYAR